MPDIRKIDITVTLDVLSRGEISKVELKSVLTNKLPGVGGRFNNLIQFLEEINLISISRGQIAIKSNIFNTLTEKYFVQSILKCSSLARDFSKYCKLVEFVHVPEKSISISSTHTASNFLWFLLILEQFNVLRREHNTILLVNTNYFDIFLTFVSSSLIELRNSVSVTPETLVKRQAANAEAGLLAEKFVISYERIRLKEHPLCHMITHVALNDVSAGFDILSFDSEKDLALNRIIEVKSWSQIKRYYLSSAEHLTAKHFGERYHIYLVDRNRMNEEGYSPEIFTHPYESLSNVNENSDWTIEPDGFLVTYKSP